MSAHYNYAASRARHWTDKGCSPESVKVIVAAELATRGSASAPTRATPQVPTRETVPQAINRLMRDGMSYQMAFDSVTSGRTPRPFTMVDAPAPASPPPPPRETHVETVKRLMSEKGLSYEAAFVAAARERRSK